MPLIYDGKSYLFYAKGFIWKFILTDFVIVQSDYVGGSYTPGNCLTKSCPSQCDVSFVFDSMPYCISQSDMKTQDSEGTSCDKCGSDYGCLGDFCLICPNNCGPPSCFLNSANIIGCCSNVDSCEECKSECKICNGVNGNCLTCVKADFEPSATGVCGCKAGYAEAADGTCEKIICNEECASCLDTSKCTTCIDSNASPSLTSGCDCKDSYYSTSALTTDGSCLSCSSECLTCNQADICLTCKDSLSLTTACDCKDGYYKTTSLTTIGSCLACSIECQTCDQADKCLTCKDSNAYLSKTGCVCKDEYYSTTELSSGGSCLPCSSTCATCKGSDDACIKCKDLNSYADENGQCVCKTKFFSNVSISEGGTCEACDPACTNCNSTDPCFACIAENAYLDESSRCVCKKGYFNLTILDSEDSCIACHSDCKSCYEFDTCLKCVAAHAIPSIDGGCVCDFGYFNNTPINTTGSCLECSGNCSSCTDTEKNCLSCEPGFILFENSCLENCPQNYSEIDQVCVECEEPNCQNSSTNGTDNNNKSSTSDYTGFLKGSSKLPFTIVTGSLGLALVGSKILLAGAQITPAALSGLSLISTTSWILQFSNLVYIGNEGRRLRQLSFENSLFEDGNGEVDNERLIYFIIICFVILVQLILNIAFNVIFIRNNWNDDLLFRKWRKKHFIATSLVFGFSFMINLSVSQLFNCGVCIFKDCLKDAQNFKKLMVKFGLAMIVFTLIPIIGADAYFLYFKDMDDDIWRFSLDSLIISCFFMLFLIFEAVSFVRKHKVGNENRTKTVSSSYDIKDSREVNNITMTVNCIESSERVITEIKR